MARGQYEQPYHHRPRPIFGPPRPPISPSRSSSQSSTSSSPTSPASSIASPLVERSQNIVVIVSITKSDQYEHQITNIKKVLESDAVVEEIETVDEALRALARNPKAVIMNKDTLQDPLFEHLRPETSRYVQTGGSLITDVSEALFALKNSPRPTIESLHSWHRVEW